MKHFLIALFTLLGASAAQANNCYQLSPDLAASGDSYYDIITDTKLDRTVRRQLAQTYKLLEGKWRGQLTEMLCKGPERDIRVEYRNYQLESKVKAGQNGSLHIQSNRHWIEKRRRMQINRHLFGPEGAYKVLDIGANHLEVAHKYRTSTVNSNSIFRETITRLERSDNDLLVTISDYINGVLVSSESAQMTKK